MPQSFAEELGSIPTSPSLGQSLERAHGFAREQSHRVVTLEHLLLALIEDAEAALILQSANIDLARLGTEVSGYLGRLLEDMRSDGTVEPRPDADLLRVLQAAASAAKQSRRKQIDGAIVLAAVVGDGKSPAAGLLKAMGMTFEEAIRALQRANTKARLKPTPKSAEAPSPVAQAPSEPTATEPAPPDASASAPVAAESAVPETAPGVSQSAEEILAAARARIQQRSAAGRAEAADAGASPRPTRSGKGTSTPTADSGEPSPELAAPAGTESLTEAIEAAMTGPRIVEAKPPPARAPSHHPAARMPQPAAPQPAPPIAQHARSNWTPPPEPRPQPAMRLPQPPARPQPPFPARPIAPGEGPRRPPLPPAPHAGQPQAGFPNRPARAPWPEPGERVVSLRPGLPNGAVAEQPSQQAPWSVPPARGNAPSDKALLVESVPRRMRLGAPATAEVRIARDRIEALIVTLNGRGSPALAEHALTRALSVRLRAPGGDFWIEPAAPETQWVEGGANLIHDDHAVWRWTVVARRRGRGRLALMVSARTIGRDGVAAESAPPDRVIEVKVAGNVGKAFARWLRWLVALSAGALAGHFGQELLALAKMAIARATVG